MKCQICNRSLRIDNLHDFMYLHNICNKCTNLFIYSLKSVRINGVEIKVRYLKFYRNIYEGNYLIHSQNFNNYMMNKYLKNKKFLSIKEVLNDKISSEKVIYILFDRREYQELFLIIKKLSKYTKIRKIFFYEIL